jgi:hypothetical protein
MKRDDGMLRFLRGLVRAGKRAERALARRRAGR